VLLFACSDGLGSRSTQQVERGGNPGSATTADVDSGSRHSDPTDAAVECENGATRECIGSAACSGRQQCVNGEWGLCDCGTVVIGDAGVGSGGSIPDEAGAGGQSNAGSAGEGPSGGTGGNINDEPRCDWITSCATETDSCAALLGTEGTACTIGTYSCGTKSGWYTSDGLDFPCDQTPIGLDCNQASADVLEHCYPSCQCPGPNEWPENGYITCDSQTLNCDTHCFQGFDASGDECIAPELDPCWSTCFGYCDEGVCFECPTAYVDCDNDETNKCEQFVNDANCGQCGFGCEPSKHCAYSPSDGWRCIN
jgi:hypothetical protein